jgi:hypothetical protein
MARRKYRFPDRASAEEAWLNADNRRLYAEWFASAILMGRTHTVDAIKDGDRTEIVGFFVTRYCAFVYAVLTGTKDSFHVIRGIWECDDRELDSIIRSHATHGDKIGELYDKARTACRNNTHD